MNDLPFDPEHIGTLYCAVFGSGGGLFERFIDENAMGSIEAQIERGAPWVEFDSLDGSTLRIRSTHYVGTYMTTEATRRLTIYHDQALQMEQERHEEAFRTEYGWRPRDD